MSYNIKKLYPENYSKDIVDVISAITFKHGEKPYLYGSGRFKLDYPSDYDLEQQMNASTHILPDFQAVIKSLLKMKDTYIGDIKCGMIPHLKILDNDLSQSNYMDKQPMMVEKVKKLFQMKHITKEEERETLDLLKPNLTQMDIYILKEKIKFETIRWKPADILNGFVNYRGLKIGFYDYLYNEGLTKIDVITWLNGVRFNEVSMVYIFYKNGVSLNRKEVNGEGFIKVLIDQIPYLLYAKKYMKICKRINSIERAKTKPNEDLLYLLSKLFNSSLGRLNQVLSDIITLEFLIENVNLLPKEKFDYEMNQMKYRLGNMTNRKYLENQDKIIRLLNIIEKDTLDFNALDKLRSEIFNILETETLKFMKEYNLYPIPRMYLPQNINGEGIVDKVFQGINYLSNKFKPSDENATETEANEKHGVLILPNGKIGRANYMGPGTNLIKRIKRGDKPRTAMDELSRAHDIRYDLAKSQKDIADADEIFIKGAKKIKKEKLDNPLNVYVGQIPIQAKYYAEKHGIVKPSFKKSENISIEDETLIKKILADAIKKGYGNKVSMSKADLLKEHKRLIRILEHGTKEEQKKEALDQLKEMKKYEN